jgi:acyl-coenzyme A thioesterase PaaI-like protein
MQPRTHLGIRHHLCGAPRTLAPGVATVVLRAIPDMAADDTGLVHGGFIFGLADYAAMLAINEPTVVLGAAETRFLAPSRVGDELLAEAEALPAEGKKRSVRVHVLVANQRVFEGLFTCFVPAQHVLHEKAREQT